MSSPSPLLRCFAFYRRQKAMLALATTIAIAVNLSMPLTQYLVGRALHDVELGQAVVRLDDGGFDASRAWMWVGILVGVNLVRGVLGYLGAIVNIMTGQRLLHDLRGRLLAQVQRLDLGYHLAHGAGEIITRTTRDSDKVRDAVTGGWRTLLELGLIVAGAMALLCSYDVWLGLVPVLLVITAMMLILRQAGPLVELDRRTDAAYDLATQDLAEGVSGVRVIKAFALERTRIARFSLRIAAFTAEAQKALHYTATRLPVPQLVVASGHCWILWYGAGLVANGAMNRGELVASMMAMLAVIFRVENIGRVLQVFADARASAERILELLDADPAIRAGDQALPTGPLGVRFAAVRVANRDGGTDILAGLDLRIHAGEVVALVGATGSGKSTLASLLPRLRDPDAGVVSIGSDAGGWTDLRSLRLDELRRAVQVVPQESFLFTDTLANNLRQADPSASDDRLREVLRLAAADDVLAGLPDGLESRIGERGVSLSGGQRQRVCLARAILARPAILCADDATSALDAVTERRILDNLRAAAAGATVLLIASKLSTILLADRVLLLNDGRIAADGSHEQLMASSHRYRDLLGLNEPGAA
ncbi:MAG: ABC transporter ATP-binding protein [Planctomycetes bacterium]|nr:ABC transporter ATP-binding protein [Planctomycetota bacterium]